jgi:hypothetical protein
MSAFREFVCLIFFGIYHTILYQFLQLISIDSNCDLNFKDVSNKTKLYFNASEYEMQIEPNPAISVQSEELSRKNHTQEKTSTRKVDFQTPFILLDDISYEVETGNLNSDNLETVSNATWLNFCVLIDDTTWHLLPASFQAFRREIRFHSGVSVVAIDLSPSSHRATATRVSIRFPEFQVRELQDRRNGSCSEAEVVDHDDITSCAESKRTADLAASLLQCAERVPTAGWVVLLDAAAAPCDGALDQLITLLLLMAERPSLWRSARFTPALLGLALPKPAVLPLATSLLHWIPSSPDSVPRPWGTGRDFSYPGGLFHRPPLPPAAPRAQALLERGDGWRFEPGGACAFSSLADAAAAIFDAHRN